MKMFRILIILLIIVQAIPVLAQNILLDQMVKCGDLNCFPSSSGDKSYYYLPSNPRIATKKNGKPEFSFLHYVDSSEVTGKGGIAESGGGGIVHFLVDYKVSDAARNKAERELKNKINPDAILKGPILYEEGSFALVTSFQEGQKVGLKKKIIGVGKAPLVEGLKAAVSIHLNKQGANLLAKSFEMATPDISIVFEMQFSGLRDPAEATIIAKWDKLHKQTTKEIGGKFGWGPITVGFDYKDFFEKMKNSGAIVIEYKGDTKKFNAIVDRAYSRLQEMMFQPLDINELQNNSSNKENPYAEIAGAIADVAAKEGGKVATAGYHASISAGLKRRKIKQTGEYRFNFRDYVKDKIITVMAGNIGNLFQKYGADETIFRVVHLDSPPEFLLRHVEVSLNAKNLTEFSKFVDSVNIKIRKKHGSGQQDSFDIGFRNADIKNGKIGKIQYSWKDEPNLEQWYRYEYQVSWNFGSGRKSKSEQWIISDDMVLSLAPPFEFRTVYFEADSNVFKENNIRSATVRVWNAHGEKRDHLLLDPRRELSIERKFAVESDEPIEYQITWNLNNGSVISGKRIKSNQIIIYCDNLPN